MMRRTVRGHRRSIRLNGYDYASAGTYFVTICAQDRACVFGTIADGVMRANDAGRMVERWWDELPRAFADTETDAFVVMPNHVHGVVVLVGADQCVCPGPAADQRVCPGRDATGRCVYGGRTRRFAPTGSAPTGYAGTETTTAGVVAADRTMVQNDDDQRIHPWRSWTRVARVSRPFMAAELLRTDCARR